MKFRIVTKEIKVKEYRVALKDFEESLILMSRFMVDEETGERISPEDGMDILDNLDLETLQEVQITFMESFVPNQKSAHR